MSKLTSKDYRELQEAYNSIYTNKSENLTEDTVVDELQEDYYDINEDSLYESMINYLVYFGYASDEKNAEAMLPHMSEQWANTFAMEYVLAENFEYLVEYLVQEEGYDFGSTTLDELYEIYVRSYSSQNLNEAVFTGTAAATAPLWWPAAAAGLAGLGAVYAANKKKADDWATRQVQRATDFVMQSKRRSRRQRGQQKSQTPAQTPASTSEPKPTSTPTSGSTGGTGSTTQGSAPQQPEPPKGPNRVQRWWRDISSGATQEIKRKATERAAERAARQAARANRPPSPVLQAVGRKAVQIGKGAAWTGLAAGTGGLIDQGLLGGVGGKVARDVYNVTRQTGPAYERLKKRLMSGDKEKEEKRTKPQNIPGFN